MILKNQWKCQKWSSSLQFEKQNVTAVFLFQSFYVPFLDHSTVEGRPYVINRTL